MLCLELFSDFWVLMGSFYVCLSRYFDCIDVCKVRNGWHERRLQGILPPFADLQNLSCILITVMEATEIELSLFQEGHRWVVIFTVPLPYNCSM